MINQNKIFSFKIKCQAKNVFPSDVERTEGIIFPQDLHGRKKYSVAFGQTKSELGNFTKKVVSEQN